MSERQYTRVAVAQIACLPAIALPGKAPLEDPLFAFSGRNEFHPSGSPPPELEKRFADLRGRLSQAYCEQLLLKVKAILERCRQWEVQVLVFPEYSLPWQLLEPVVEASAVPTRHRNGPIWLLKGTRGRVPAAWRTRGTSSRTSWIRSAASCWRNWLSMLEIIPPGI